MKLTVFDASREPEPELSLKLTPSISQRDTAYLNIVDASGSCRERGTLLAISAAGIRRGRSVDPDFGLPLDDAGRVLLVDEYNRLADVLELIKPFAECAATIGSKQANGDVFNYLCGKPLTVGQYRALAAFYEANK